MAIEIRRSSDRYLTENEGRSTAHSFSFGEHYDPRNLGFGALVAHNDEVLEVGAGYEPHLHRETEIVTWVLTGALQHSDDLGNTSIVRPGQVQVLSSGSGVTHAEVNAAEVPTRFIQAWLRPDVPGTTPAYAVADIEPTAGWTVLAGEGGLLLGLRGATLYLGRLTETTALPTAPYLHVFVIEGSLDIGEREVREGSAARLTDEAGRLIKPTSPATVMVWAFNSGA